jgi:hypothetical protein
MQEFLDRRDSLLFRERVTVLFGEPSDIDARSRFRMDRAREIVVLPSMTTADAGSDDAMNIMRAFAVSSSVPHVRCVCMLHSMEHRPLDFVHEDGKNVFMSIGAFKLAMLAKACLVPGVIAFICNLCQTVGDSEYTPEPWQKEYECGLGMEIYQATMSDAYNGSTFQEIAIDILARSQYGNVYLIGFSEVYTDDHGRLQTRLQIHPGAEYKIDNTLSEVRGIFIAGEIGDIIQRGLDEVALCPLDREKVKTLRGSINLGLMKEEEGLMEEDEIETLNETSAKADLRTKERRGSNTSSQMGTLAAAAAAMAETAGQFDNVLFERNKLQLSLEEKAKRNALKGYEAAMAKIGRNLLTSGVDTGIVAEICTEPKDKNKEEAQGKTPVAK